MSFQKETPILYLNPRTATRWSKQLYLLWPAWYYRVVAPRVQSRKVNILEKAVLGMCRVGTFSAAEIGDKLDIGTDLAALVIQQLSDQGLIDNRGLLTNRGLDILEQETLTSQDMVAGFIFQDAWTGELLPRFVERLEYAEVKFNDEGFPELVFGTTGKPEYRRAYMPLSVKSTVSQPSPKEILEAVRKHGKALRERGKSESEEIEDEEKWTFDRVPVLNRISFVEEEPTPVWVATFIYLPENSLSATNWNICDPFGMGDSPWLRRLVEKQIKNKTLSGLNNEISRRFGDRRDEDGKNRGFAEMFEFAHNEAVTRVEDELTIEIRRWDSLFNSLVAMQRTYIEAELIDGSKKLADKLDDVIVKAQKAVESILLDIRETYPTDNSWQVLSPRDREHNKTLLNKLAGNLGFTTPLPSSLVGVNQGKVRSAADYGEGSLRPGLLAALLTARYNSQHPLQIVAKQAPDMLERLDKLAELRDKSSHYSSQQLALPEVSQQMTTVYEFVARMLEIKCYNKPVVANI